MQGPIQLKPMEVAWEHLVCLDEAILSHITGLLLEGVGLRQHALSLCHRAVCAAEGLVRPLAVRSYPCFCAARWVSGCHHRCSMSPSICGIAATVRVRHAPHNGGWQGESQLHQCCQSILGAPRCCPVSCAIRVASLRVSGMLCCRRTVHRLPVLSG